MIIKRNKTKQNQNKYLKRTTTKEKQTEKNTKQNKNINKK